MVKQVQQTAHAVLITMMACPLAAADDVDGSTQAEAIIAQVIESRVSEREEVERQRRAEQEVTRRQEQAAHRAREIRRLTAELVSEADRMAWENRLDPGLDTSALFEFDPTATPFVSLGMFQDTTESITAGGSDPLNAGEAQVSGGGGPSAEAQANNPLANIVALNFQNYYIGELTESGEDANQFVVRYAQPISIGDSNWLVRASLPLNTFPTPPDGSKDTGLGDLNVFAAYLFDTGNPAVSFGFGPQATFPTATEDALGSEQWSLGFANVLFDARSPKFQWGYLLTWQHSVAGDDDRDDVNFLAFQPFGFYQLGEGWYLRAAPIWAFNLENGDYSIPMGVGIGKVVKTEKAVLNFFVEPQFSVADEGPGQPEWQLYFALNMQFPF